MSDPQELRVRRFLDRIDAARRGGNEATLRSLIEDIETEWREKKDPGYFRVLVELCDMLSSTNAATCGRRELVRKLVIGALDAPGDKPIDTEVKLILQLQSDWDYMRSSRRQDQWQAERQVDIGRWLTTWRHLRQDKDRLEKEVGGKYKLSVRPPPENGIQLPAGVSPSAIKDPVLRKEYEEAITKNSEVARVNRMKAELKNLEPQFTTAAKRYIINAYSEPPFQTQELDKMLDEYGVEKDVRVAMVDEVKKRIASQIEQQAVPVKITEPKQVDPATRSASPWRVDPRLQVKVSLDLASPLVDDVLRELHTTTGVDLSRGDDIQAREPALGSLSTRNTPAWRIMDDLAASKRVEGRWETDGAGYRLVSNGTPVNLSGDSPGRLSGGDMTFRIIMASIGLAVVLIGGVYWLRRSWVKRA